MDIDRERVLCVAHEDRVLPITLPSLAIVWIVTPETMSLDDFSYVATQWDSFRAALTAARDVAKERSDG